MTGTWRRGGEDLRQRWLLVLIGAVAVLIGSLVGWLYTHPPLESNGGTRLYDQEQRTLAYGIDLHNSGRWPLTLTAVTINGQAIEYPQAMAVANFTDTQFAGNAAVKMEENNYKLTVASVNGWKMQPRRPSTTYGLRLDWKGGPTDQVQVIVHYRYLGLPMKCSITGVVTRLGPR